MGLTFRRSADDYRDLSGNGHPAGKQKAAWRS